MLNASTAAVVAANLRDQVAARIADHGLTENETADLVATMDAHDDTVREAACTTRADALAKLGAILIDLEEGERANASVSAGDTLRQIMTWLKGH